MDERKVRSNIWAVFWVWLGVSFGLWLIAGRLVWNLYSARVDSGPSSGSSRAILGALFLLLGMGVLFGLFMFLSATQEGGKELSPVQMAATTLAGAIFAASQSAAAAVMLSTVERSVTNRRRPPSIIENKEGMDS